MAFDLGKIQTLVVVMMENRSFDHMLGYLSLAGKKNVEGLQSDAAWLASVANPYMGTYPPFALTDPYNPIAGDPPHEYTDIALQMGQADAKGIFPLKGFVESYSHAKEKPPIDSKHLPAVMGYFSAAQVPVTDFFARNFALCDHWFSAIPAGTQPNRLMAMSGQTKINANRDVLPTQQLVYDWLMTHRVSWRVYHEGLPFFALMPRWISNMLREENFRPLSRLDADIASGDIPQVIFIEPVYTDAPHIGISDDDHAPSGICHGQEFLGRIYASLTVDAHLWSSMLMVVTYDEHGGFFDHVSPPSVPTAVPAGAYYNDGFKSLGIRVPAFIISPFVEPGSVFNGVLDHTSILKLIGAKFDQAGSYAPVVDSRPVGNVLEALSDAAPVMQAPALPSLASYRPLQAKAVGFTPEAEPVHATQNGFQKALDTIRNHPDNIKGTFDELLSQFPKRF